MSTPPCPDRRGGFTLVETLAALAITAVVLGAAWTAVVRAAAARDQAQARARTTTLARDALLALAGEVAVAGPDGVVVAAPPGTPLLRWQAREPLPHVVTLALDGDTLVRREVPAFAATDRTPPAAVPLLHDVRRLSVRAFDGRTWSDVWRDARLPRALELVLETRDGERWSTRVRLALAEAPQ